MNPAYFKQINSLLLALSFIACCTQAVGQTPPLSFPGDKFIAVQEAGMHGYINSQGIAIPLQFENALYFSEGLAAVRQGGYFGYIDTSGAWAIEPQFEYARGFRNGRAIVYGEQGAPNYIDRKGKLLLKGEYKKLYPFDTYGGATVVGKNGNTGRVNSMGTLFVDTIYYNVRPFHGGVYGISVVNKEEASFNSFKEYAVELILADGEKSKVFEKYTLNRVLKGGFVEVHLKEDPAQDEKGKVLGIVNAQGELLFSYSKDTLRLNPFDDNKGKETLFTAQISKKDEVTGRKNKWVALINSKGEIVKQDKSWSWISQIYGNRAFVHVGRNLICIDGVGNRIGTDIYRERYFGEWDELLFGHGYEIVNKEGQWIAIDRDGRHIADFFPVKAHPKFYRWNNILYCREEHHNFIFWEFENNQMRKLSYEESLPYVSHFNLIYDYYKESFSNALGNVVWANTAPPKPDLNVDYKATAEAQVASPFSYFFDEYVAIKSKNMYTPMSSIPSLQDVALQTKEEDGLVLHVDTVEDLVSIINLGRDTLFFTCLKSGLHMHLEAQNRNGEWVAIEIVDENKVGESCHIQFLPTQNAWGLPLTTYKGSIHTKLRYAIGYFNEQKDDLLDDWENGEKFVYSNTFSGTINPAQLWRGRTTFPTW